MVRAPLVVGGLARIATTVKLRLLLMDRSWSTRRMATDAR